MEIFKIALLFGRLIFSSFESRAYFCCCCDPRTNIPSCLNSDLVSTDQNQRPTFPCLIKWVEQRIFTFVETLIPGTLHHFQSQSYVTLECFISLCFPYKYAQLPVTCTPVCCSCVSLCKGVSLQCPL